ncbi:MAG: GNAT family N-acetyltransferase [Hydrotalea sp.]|nr:GNAT family N-acetyltransferase [Hydrotalea sp.]
MMIEKIAHFDALSPKELYDIIQLRNEVFVVEQQCIFQDADGKDPKCYHLMMYEDDQLVAYARLVPAGLAFEHMSIGRVISNPAFRRQNYGRKLMEKAIQHCEHIFGDGPIQIGAQLYLQKFYESFGFKVCSDVYDEDGIDHIEMIRS